MYTLLNRHVHSVIDDITGQVAHPDDTAAAPPAEETNQVPPRADVKRRALFRTFWNLLDIESF